MNFVDPGRKSASEIYSDIIDLPHPVSLTRPKMERLDRAAQFAPFAALTGYEEAVDETGRLTTSLIEISEEKRQQIDIKIKRIIGLGDTSVTMPSTIIYYQPDKYKNGGAYLSHDALVKKYDDQNSSLVMKDSTVIPIKYIFDIR